MLWPKVPEMQDFSTHIVRFLFIALVIGFVVFVVYGLTALSVQFLVALIVAFLLTPLVNSMEGLGIPRVFAVFSVLGGLFCCCGLFLYWAGPIFMAEVADLLASQSLYEERLGLLLAEIRQLLSARAPGLAQAKYLQMDYVKGLIEEPLGGLVARLPSYLPVLFTSSIITPIILVVFLLQGPQLFRNLLSMVPNRYFEMTLLLAFRIRRQISSYLLGMMLQWTIIFLILASGYSVFGLPYAPVVALIGATLNAVPYIGPVVGLAPALFMATGAVDLMLPVLLVFGIAQLVDNVFNQPVLLARSVDIHPLIAILAFITFSEILGLMGMLIAIPLAAMILVTIQIMYRSLKAFKII